MSEPLDPRPQQTLNRLRLAVLLPVLLAVVAIILFAAKLARQFSADDEPAERTFAPSRPSVAGPSLSEVADGVVESPLQKMVPGRSNSVGALRAMRALRGEPARPFVVPGSPTNDSATVSSPVSPPPALVQPVLVVTGVLPNGIVGRVFLRGTPPPEAAIPMDPACGALHAGLPRPTTRFYVIGTNGGLADVFVVLKDFPASRFEPAANAVEIRQRGCEYLPYISAAHVSQTIRVFNDDPLMHNVHPTPTTEGNKEQNRAQLPKGAPLDFIFTMPELFLRFKCDVHPWMFAYVNVVEHLFYAVSGTDGQFALLEPPPGEYTLQFIHRKAGGKLVPVKKQAGKRLVVNVTFDCADRTKSEATVTEE